MKPSDQLSALTNWEVTVLTCSAGDLACDYETLLWKDGSGPLAISRLQRCAAGSYRLRLGGEIVVDVFPDQRIVARSTPKSAEATLDHFLADQVFPRVLAHGDEFVVHAGAVRLDDQAILLLAPSGRGKSTLTASFVRGGLCLLGDDSMLITWCEGLACAKALYPSMRLFPDSIAAILPMAVPTTPVAHYSAKRRIDVIAPGQSAPAQVPIEAIFLLREPSSDDQVRVDRLTVAQACMAIVANSFALDPTDLRLANLRLQHATALARQVPAFGLSYPRDYDRLAEVQNAILSQLANFPPPGVC